MTRLRFGEWWGLYPAESSDTMCVGGVRVADQEPPEKQPRVRLWLVSLLLFAGGFVGKLVLEGGKPPDQGYPVVMLWQMSWYAGGLVVWVWWASTRPVGDKVGCWAGVALVAFAVLAVLSSSPK